MFAFLGDAGEGGEGRRARVETAREPVRAARFGNSSTVGRKAGRVVGVINRVTRGVVAEQSALSAAVGTSAPSGELAARSPSASAPCVRLRVSFCMTEIG